MAETIFRSTRVARPNVSDSTSRSRGVDSARVVDTVSLRHGGSRECRVRAAPAVSCAKLCKETHTSIQVQRRQSGIPCAMALRLMPCSPRRRIRLVTVIGGLTVLQDPVGPAETSADLTPATGARTTRFCRTRPVLAKVASPDSAPPPKFLRSRRAAPFVLRAGRSLTKSKGLSPAIPLAPDAAASTASHPNVRDDGQRPS